MSNLLIQNRQRAYPVHLPLLRRIARALLSAELAARPYQVGIYLLSSRAMARLNAQYLQHSGSTDVLTFSYAGAGASAHVEGEIFICVEEAVRQAKQFHTAWQEELVRYLAHGLLHLLGHDDRTSEQRRSMKRHENRLVHRLSQCFPLRDLSPQLKISP